METRHITTALFKVFSLHASNCIIFPVFIISDLINLFTPYNDAQLLAASLVVWELLWSNTISYLCHRCRCGI